MATFKAEIQNKRADGTYNVRIRITHNREVRRLSTQIYVTDEDLTRGGKKIKNYIVLDQCEKLISKCRLICNDLGYEISAWPVDQLVDAIKNRLVGDNFKLDFIAFTEKRIETMKPGTARFYQSMLSAVKRFIRRDGLDISEITTNFLRQFEQFIENEPDRRGNNRKKPTSEIKPKGGRAVSAYLIAIRSMHNAAKTQYNDEDRGVIRIPYSPFKNFKIKPQPLTRKRALHPENIQKIIDLPYEPERGRGHHNRVNLAKDCFILSFALIGMNSVDMFQAPKPKGGIIGYNRQKTAARRADRAEMKIKPEYVISYLMEKYADDERLFNFHRHYASPNTFNEALNAGLKQIGEKIGVDDLEFYAARHSWATLARSSAVGIDKATVHEALNHVDSDMKVTDIYIDRDWTVIWDANKKVLALFDWSELELMYLL